MDTAGLSKRPKISSQDPNLQRTVEQTLVDPIDESISQIMEERFEVDKIVLQGEDF